ncbi:Dinitrogenase iron-molybdenum cofactor domain-containing protein [Desulfonema limicola]|uniref:Dinitrogenase iron-molybdenum cofactor domain-containing protein n=1 Tax=Desulfonema limicola TaxID=45656 RepID=A0A975GFM8_9BACT|nr:NifB/NifX family molybdenum-iron cluster-binding protein [Desulfonema limicola]QTA79350.1 Dinitrogenase iron-molybdenum cofactor domain-containing protein [Desulfonema limicola]
MKLAITVWEDRISPLFDASQKLLVAEIRNAKVCSRQYQSFQPGIPLKQAGRLRELEVDVLICGAISEMPSTMINSYGISLIPFITGKVEEVLNAYIDNTLNKPEHHMPGCRFRCGRHGARQHGHNHTRKRRCKSVNKDL